MGAPRKHPEICTIDGCDRPHEAKGMCHRHYKAWRRRNDPKVIEARKIEKKRYRERKKKERRCRQIFNRAVQNGLIERQPCEECDKPEAHGHHDDYDKPFKVKWLCDEHHQEHHNGVSKCQKVRA